MCLSLHAFTLPSLPFLLFLLQDMCALVPSPICGSYGLVWFGLRRFAAWRARTFTFTLHYALLLRIFAAHTYNALFALFLCAPHHATLSHQHFMPRHILVFLLFITCNFACYFRFAAKNFTAYTYNTFLPTTTLSLYPYLSTTKIGQDIH